MKITEMIGAAVVAGLLAVAAGFYIASLRSQLDLAAEELTHAKQGVVDRDNIIGQLRETERTNDLARARLEGERSGIRSLLETRENQIRNLQRENDEYRAWAAIAVPLPVSRMREHGPIVGAAAYRERMSPGPGLPPAGSNGGK